VDVTWLGHACIRLRGKDGVILMDPCSKSTGYSIGKQSADIVTASRADPEHAFTEAVTPPFRLLDAPGEYEISGVLLNGVNTTNKGKDRKADGVGRNVAFVVEIDDLRVCHLGDLDHTPGQDLIEQLSDIDILLTPVGGHGALDAAAAAEVISLLQPRLVIPIRYQTDASTMPLDPLDPFIKQLGREAPDPQARLSITRSNLPEETQLVVLDYRK
jgi:L-ascorbate metabolism protein UlaG (beta-lactamase superfamily)